MGPELSFVCMSMQRYFDFKLNGHITGVQKNQLSLNGPWSVGRNLQNLKFFLKDQQIKLIRKTIKTVESELSSRHFLRIHKSYIVNINCVKSIEGNQVKLEDLYLPIGKSYSVNVKKSLGG